MDTILGILQLVHVTVGFAGLAAFWVPIFARKGGIAHRSYGRIYRNCAYIVVASAGLAVVLRAAAYLAEGKTPASAPGTFAALLFLGYLATITFVIVRHGVHVLAHKGNPQAMDTAPNRWLARLCMFASLIVIAYALAFAPPNRIVLYALSPIGILGGLGILRYIGAPAGSPRAWLYEHLGAMLGGGIAFHTAFAVFGATRLFDIGLEGWIAVLPWIAPAAIGIPATVIWTRHYQRKFGELG